LYFSGIIGCWGVGVNEPMPWGGAPNPGIGCCILTGISGGVTFN